MGSKANAAAGGSGLVTETFLDTPLALALSETKSVVIVVLGTETPVDVVESISAAGLIRGQVGVGNGWIGRAR